MEFDPDLHQQLTQAVIVKGVQQRRRLPIVPALPTISGRPTEDGYAVEYMGLVTILNPAVVDAPSEDETCLCRRCRPRVDETA